MSQAVALAYQLVEHDEARVRSVRGTRADDLVGLDLGATIERLTGRLDGAATIAWHDHRQDALDSIGWPARLEGSAEIRHLGLASTPDIVLRALQAVAGEDPFVVPSGPRRVTWLLGGNGIATAATLRRLGPIDPPAVGGVAARLARLGLRAFDAGVLPVHDLGLGSPSLFDTFSAGDLQRLIAHRWGATRRGPLRMARLLPPSPRAAVALPAIEHRAADPGDLGDQDGVDVVIPTLERPAPLRDLLDDLACQAPPPHRVVIIEQRPDGSPSALDALRETAWPFDLILETTSQLGASRARNRALRRTRARFVALLDDDVRLAPGLLAAMVAEADEARADVLSIAEVGPEVPLSSLEPAIGGPPPRPVLGLGSGRTLVRRAALNAVGGFDETLEGWGEDVELGLRLNHAGFAVLVSRRLALVHLKAPRGGFRSPRRTPWDAARIKPLPSPLIAYRWRRFMPPAMLVGTVRTHLLRTARRRALGPFSLPWLWLRWQSAARWAERIGGPRLGLFAERER